MKAIYTSVPKTIEAIGNGSYHFRWNIELFINNDGIEQYRCDEVVVWSLNSADITKKVIEELWPISYEQKLINDYNSYTLGVLPEEYKDRYITYLVERNKIKKMIDESLL